MSVSHTSKHPSLLSSYHHHQYLKTFALRISLIVPRAIIHTNTTSTIMAPYLIQPTVSVHYDEFEGVPTPVYSQTYAGRPTPTTDDGLRQFAIAMAIIGALFLVACVYTVAKYYLGKRRAELEVDDPELAVAAAFKPPTIAVPPLSATFGRVPAYQQERPFYISQADMLSGHGRGFFG
ncbi:hypothetical protein C8F04DRAFT_1267857 [Mycena alexandri]|uniref:Transmembrane protein n=1 Tax=Mycena alexandri TaxID=1745969 RepID=A0AAD6SGY5_9AGAR|nr:hypothetical protein C8F04DRAFT_1267857 [Mycena alexandri]